MLFDAYSDTPYESTINLGKRLNLTGIGYPTIMVKEGPIFIISADNCTIEGFRLEGSAWSEIVKVKSSENIIRNNIIMGKGIGSTGITIESEGNSILNNTILYCHVGLEINGNKNYLAHNVINSNPKNNPLISWGYGIIVDGDANTFYSNKLLNCKQMGISIDGKGNVIIANLISKPDTSLYLNNFFCRFKAILLPQ